MPRIPSSFSTDLHQCIFPNASIPASHSFVSPSPEHLFLPDTSVHSPVAKPVYYVPKDIHVFVDRQGGVSWTGRSCLGDASVSFPSSLRVELVLDVARGLDVVVVEDLRVPGEHLSAKRLVHVTDRQDVHHDLPRVHGQVGIVKAPVKLLLGHGLVAGVVVRREVLVRESLGRRYPLLGVEHQHALEQVNSYNKVSTCHNACRDMGAYPSGPHS